MRSRSISKLARPEVKRGPPLRVRGKVEAGLSTRRSREYAARLAAALPVCIEAPPGERRWRSALVGPARYPDGYRDVVILAAGRLLPSTVRQTGRGGNLHEDPAAEIGRVVDAYRGEDRPHGDRLLRPLVPHVAVDGAWLRQASRHHDVPLNPSLASALLEEVCRSGDAEKAEFRRTLDPEVAKLLPTDEDLKGFHDWLSDHRIDPVVRVRRCAAFASLRAGCSHIRQSDAHASRLDAGEDAFALLGEVLDASPDALRELAGRQIGALVSVKEAQRKAWALELMPKERLKELKDALERAASRTGRPLFLRRILPDDPKELEKAALDMAGGWAARAMTFGTIVSDDPKDRRDAARRLLERRGLSRFIDYPKTFGGWSDKEGEQELVEMLRAVVRFGLLPTIMDEADGQLRAPPTAAQAEAGVRELARIVSASFGIMTVEIARLEWRKVAPWLAKNLVAVCHSSFGEWPPLIAPFKGINSKIDCLASRKALEDEDGRLKAGPNVFYDVLAEGAHVLRLQDEEGTTIALGVVRQAELEAAKKRGHVGSQDIERDGWAAKAQWKRLMRVEIARIIDLIAAGKDEPRCDLADLRRRLDDRAQEAEKIAKLPCGFDHTKAQARSLADSALRHVMKQIVRNPPRLAHQLFGAPRDPSLEADAAWLDGTPIPAPPPSGAPRPPVLPADEPISPLLLPLAADELAAPAEYNPSAAMGRIRLNILKGKPAVPQDPLRARFVVMDVETTGLVVARDRMVEIAAIELRGASATGEVFQSLIKTDRAISDGALEVHGITEEMLRDQPTFADVAERLEEFLARPGTWLVAHNAEFDVGIVNRELELAGRKFRVPTNRSICTLRMAGGSKLDVACATLGIDRSSRTKHRARLDAELCAEVFRRLVFGRVDQEADGKSEDHAGSPGVPAAELPGAPDASRGTSEPVN